MKNPMNILIIGANFSNKGAEAMLKTVQQELSRKYKDVTFYMICREYEKELAEQNGFVPVFDESSEMTKQFRSLKWRVEGKFLKVVLNKKKPFYFPFPFDTIQKKIKKLDLVIDVSGFAYADSWGKPMIDETIKLMDFCRRKYNSKFYFLPQAWGSFDKPEVAASANQMLGKASRFYARDHVSRKFLSRIMNKQEQEIPLLHDIVFTYDGSEKINPAELMKSIGYSKNNRPLIGISPNLRVFEKLEGKGIDNKYIKIMMALCNHCLNELDADIVLVPNELFPDGAPESAKANDDRMLCRMLNEMINRPDRCFIVDGYRSSEEIKAVISQVDVLVSSRFHALIFGLLHSVPVMAISWSHKYKELLSLFDLEEYVLEWDAMDSDSALKLFKKLYNGKDQTREQIFSNLGSMKAKIDLMFAEVASVPTGLQKETTTL